MELCVGILSGLISGAIVTFVSFLLSNRREKQLKFYNDKQVFMSYLDMISMELELLNPNPHNNLLRAIENEPIRYSFKDGLFDSDG